MATAERGRSWTRLGPWAAAAVAAVAGLAVARPAPTPATGPTPAPEEPVSVAATSAVIHESVASLRDASDLVVRGRILGHERGPVIGQPSAEGEPAGVVTRRLTVEVLDVLAGPDPGSRITIDEEGWLLDGRAIALNGVTPPAVGAEAVWFLVPLPAGAGGGHIQVNGQGRFEILPGSALRGSDPGDRLVRQVEAAGLDALLAGARA